MIKYRVQLALMKIETHKSEILSNESFDFILYDAAYKIFQKIRLFILKLKDEYRNTKEEEIK